MKMFTVFCVLIISLNYCDGYFPRVSKHLPPRIENNNHEYVIKSGDSLTLECTGSKPVVWKYPNATIDGNNWSTVEVYVSDGRNSYNARLTLRNASYVDTGFFYCYEEGTSELDPETSTNCYVFVEDPYNLKVASSTMDFIEAYQNQTTIIPCRPTSPRVQVLLYKDHSDEIISTFNPKYGFEIRIKSVLDSGSYNCDYIMGDNADSQSIELYVHPTPDSVATPHIHGDSVVTEGDGIVLNCTVEIEDKVYFQIDWSIPDELGIIEGRIIPQKALRSTYAGIGYSTLKITFSKVSDNGTYECIVKDHMNNTNKGTHQLSILDPNSSYVELTEENDVYELEYPHSDDETHVQWKINVNAHPKVNRIEWRNNKNTTIGNSTKYVTLWNNKEALLKINDVNIDDFGTYTLIGSNNKTQKSVQLHLKVREKPSVHIISDEFHMKNELSEVSCITKGYPPPDINWYFKRCLNDSCPVEKLRLHNYTLLETPHELRRESKIFINSTFTGVVKCVANNSQGFGEKEKNYYLTDVKGGFDIWAPTLEEKEGNYIMNVVLDEPFHITCGVSVYKNNTDDLNWYRSTNGSFEEINPSSTSKSRFIIINNQTSLSKRIIMSIDRITKNESGNYACRYDEEETVDLKLVVIDPKPPTFTKLNVNGSEVKVKHLTPYRLVCKANGIPKPEIIWTKDGEEIQINKKGSIQNQQRIKFLEDNSVLDFTVMLPEDEGEYACKAKNKVDMIQKSFTLLLTDKPGLNYIYVSVFVFVLIILVIVVVVLYVKVKRERKLERELRKAGLSNFEKGAVDSINQNLTIDDQAELLPYDKKWEFPREKLKLGKQLGSGAFGVVMKAEACGISEGESVSTVAVKMVKRNADSVHIKALASELKIMVHLGKNLNVVNLLGACTKNIAKKELLVIVEYCRFGNLHNYLLRHRENFIDQIDLKSGLIDVNIGAEMLEMERSMSVGSRQRSLQYPALKFHRSNSNPVCAGVDYRAAQQVQNDSGGCASPGLNSAGEEAYLVSTSGQQQPEWRSNYRGDYNRGNVKPICTSDLLCWAFQVARGMEYLSSRRVLHGDLAARNILLAEDNIVKICDFGLAKSMYKSTDYKKKGNGPLPIKWMAVESIRDKVFSTQSDVWSYGIVLWEFFSLGHTPYPGMDADERLYQRLVDGYRMDKPEFSTTELYNMMLNCWHAKPQGRPSFTQLSEMLGNMLNDAIKNHFIDLNDPYIEMNQQQDKNQDYLLMIQSPDYNNLCSPLQPDYVNDVQFHECPESPGEASGYLSMKPDIFSPRSDCSGNVFNFQTDNKKYKPQEENSTAVEIIPMLCSSSDYSDGELSPTFPTSFSNPSYQKGLKIDVDDMVKTKDNYVNMQEQKLAKTNKMSLAELKKNEANESCDDDLNNRNYINSQSRDWERPYV